MICTKRLKILFLDLELSDLILKNDYNAIKKCGIRKIEKWITNSRREEIKYYREKLKNEEVVLPIAIIIRGKNNVVIGDIQLNYNNNEVDIGYEVLESYRNKGYGTEAISEILNYIKKKCPKITITAKCFIDNKPSIKLLKHSNMVEIKRDCALIYFNMNSVS